jgi:hypothetical protein
MLRKVAMGTVAGVALIFAIGALLPRHWRAERSIVINAPPQRIHPFIANLRTWQDWAVSSKELDPQVRNTFDGEEIGVGSKWSWLGPHLGRGQMEVVKADARTGVEIDEAIQTETINAHGSFSYRPEAGATRVTWVDEGRLPFILGGYFRSSVEHALGDSFARGLAVLKRKVEAVPTPDAGQ